MIQKEQLSRWTMTKKCPYELEDFADAIGEFLQYWGFKKIHGRMWCHLFLSKRPLDAQYFIECMGISKALVSQTLCELKKYNVIQDAGKGERKTTTYVANPNLTDVIFGVLRQREKRLLSKIYSTFRLVESLPKEELDNLELDQERVKRVGLMINFAEKFLHGVLAFQKLDFGSWKKVFK